MQKAIDTTQEAAWIPTDFSASMHEQIRLARRVAALHSRVTMPTPTYKLPIEGSDATAYLVSEQGTPDADLTAANRVPSGLSPAGTTNLSLSAKKIGTRVVFSNELNEDSIIPALPYFRAKVARALSDADEEITINGDTTGTHMDSDVTAATDRRKAWKGYRKHAPAGTQIPNSVTVTQMDIVDLRQLRLKMGKYGVNPGRLVWITGPVGYSKLLGIKDGTNQAVVTVDKYGPMATLVTGELGRIDGIPVIVSEFVRENLSITGFYDGVTTDRTIVIAAHIDAFVYGDRRQATLRTQEIITTDQIAAVAMQREDFGNWFAGSTVCGFIYNIKA